MRVPTLSATNRYLRRIGRWAEYAEIQGHQRLIVHRAKDDGFADYSDLLEFWNDEIQYAARVITNGRQADAFINHYWRSTRQERNRIIVRVENWLSWRDRDPIEMFLSSCGPVTHDALPGGWKSEIAENLNGWFKGRDFWECASEAISKIDPIVRLRWTHFDAIVKGPLSGIGIELATPSCLVSARHQEQIAMGISQVGAAELKSKGPVRAAFRTVLEFLDRSPRVATLDEESLTAFMFGAVAIICDELIERYGSESVVEGRTCHLGPYKKAARGSDPHGEAASGGDFALVFGEDPDWVRLAIFQAKKGSSVKSESDEWKIDVRRRPKDPGRCAQLVALVNTGEQMAAGNASTPEVLANAGKRLKDLSSEGRNMALSKLSWIYYLGYRDKQPVCVPLTQIPVEAFEHELTKEAGRNFISLEGRPTFFDVINAGLTPGSSQDTLLERRGQTVVESEPGADARPEAIDGWLRLPRTSLSKLLPALIDLMPIYVADDDGDGDLGLDAESSPETLPVVASEGKQMKALEDDVAKIPVSQWTPPKPR